jgi:hypothetical protein
MILRRWRDKWLWWGYGKPLIGKIFWSRAERKGDAEVQRILAEREAAKKKPTPEGLRTDVLWANREISPLKTRFQVVFKDKKSFLEAAVNLQNKLDKVADNFAVGAHSAQEAQVRRAAEQVGVHLRKCAKDQVNFETAAREVKAIVNGISLD